MRSFSIEHFQKVHSSVLALGRYTKSSLLNVVAVKHVHLLFKEYLTTTQWSDRMQNAVMIKEV